MKSGRLVAAGALAAGLAAPMLLGVPTFADSGSDTQAYSGFSTAGSATPLRVELYEPAIPIPARPQLEFNLSYTHVEGASGPTSKARASALWPGSSIGEGLKTFLAQLGLPTSLAANGYPVQVNAQSPGEDTSEKQEFMPGMVGRAQAAADGAVARAGYGLDGKVAGDDDASDSLRSAARGGDLSALGTLLGGKQDAATSGNPLGVLSVLVDVGGMSSSSRTGYTSDTVTVASTSRLGVVKLLGGLVQLDGVTSSSTTKSSLDGAHTTAKVSYGGLTIAGTAFKLTSDGIEAAGKTTALPSLDPAKKLSRLGVSIALPKAKKAVEKDTGSSSIAGPTITIRTKPLLKLISLDKLGLGKLVNKLPDSAGQAKSVLLAALQAHPKVVLKLGQVSSRAETVAGVPTDDNSSQPTATASPSQAPTGTDDTTGTTPGDDTGVGNDAPDATAADKAAPVSTDDITQTSATPGLPPLGSVPGLLTVGGIAVAAGVGWWLRRGLTAVFGGGGTCSHGLPSGLPDLRKV